MIRPIRTIPDPQLKRPAEIVTSQTRELQTLAADLVDTLRSHKNCVGIAATQVGEPVRMIVIDVSRHPKLYPNQGLVVLCNPRITHASEERSTGREGCLSVPDLTGNVARHTAVTVEGISLDGAPVTVRATGFEAVVFQHEIDHLEGILFLDRVSSLSTDVFRRRKI